MSRHRLHPQSYAELRQLVKLHGAYAIAETAHAIEAELTAETAPRCQDQLEGGPDVYTCQLPAGHQGAHRNGRRCWS